MTINIKVMMVDDEPRFRETTSRLLRKKGFDIRMAQSGEEGIDILKTDPHDVVVLDVKMGGMYGHQALAQIKKIAPQTQVIMLTGHGSQDSAASSRELDAFDYLSKPCDIDLLASKIRGAHAVKHTNAAASEKKVKEIMTDIENYSSVTLNHTIKDAVNILIDSQTALVASSMVRAAGHRALIVYDTNQNLVGLFGIKDIIKAARPEFLSISESHVKAVQYSSGFSSGWDGLFSIQLKAISNKRLKDLTLDDPVIIDENANLMEVSELLFRTRKTRVLVTSAGRVTGILREQDILFEISNILNS